MAFEGLKARDIDSIIARCVRRRRNDAKSLCVRKAQNIANHRLDAMSMQRLMFRLGICQHDKPCKRGSFGKRIQLLLEAFCLTIPFMRPSQGQDVEGRTSLCQIKAMTDQPQTNAKGGCALGEGDQRVNAQDTTGKPAICHSHGWLPDACLPAAPAEHRANRGANPRMTCAFTTGFCCRCG
jgi:hypothetical protein